MKRSFERPLTSGESVNKDDDMNLGRILFSWLGLSTVTSHPHAPVASSLVNNATRVPKIQAQQWVSTPFSAKAFEHSNYNQIVQQALQDNIHEPVNAPSMLESTVLGRVLLQNKALMTHGKLSYFSLFMQTPKGVVATHMSIHALLANPHFAMNFFKRLQPHPSRWLGTFTTHEDVAALTVKPIKTLSVTQLMVSLSDSRPSTKDQQELVTLLQDVDDYSLQDDFFLPLMNRTTEMTQSWMGDASENNMRKSSESRDRAARRAERVIYGFGFEASAARYAITPDNPLAQDSFFERCMNWLWGTPQFVEPSGDQIELSTYVHRAHHDTSDTNESVATNETQHASHAHDTTRLTTGEFSQAVILGVTSTGERHLLTVPVSRLPELVDTSMLRAFMAGIEDSHSIQWLGMFATDEEFQQLREEQASFRSVTMLSQEAINDLLTDGPVHEHTAVVSSPTDASMAVEDMTRLLGALNTMAHHHEQENVIRREEEQPSRARLSSTTRMAMAMGATDLRSKSKPKVKGMSSMGSNMSTSGSSNKKSSAADSPKQASVSQASAQSIQSTQLRQKILVVDAIRKDLQEIRQSLNDEDGRTRQEKIDNFTKQQECFMIAVTALSASMQTAALPLRQEQNITTFLKQQQRAVLKLADEVALYHAAPSVAADEVQAPSRIDSEVLNPAIFLQHLASMPASLLAQIVMRPESVATTDVLSVWPSSDDIDVAFASVVDMPSADASMASVMQVCELMAITPHSQLVLRTTNANDLSSITMIDVDLLLRGTSESVALFKQLQAFYQHAMHEGMTVQMDVMVPGSQGQLESVRAPHFLTSQHAPEVFASSSMIASLPKPLYSGDEKRRFMASFALWRMMENSHREQQDNLPEQDSMIGVAHHYIANEVEVPSPASVMIDEKKDLQKLKVPPIRSTDARVTHPALLNKTVSGGAVFRYDPKPSKKTNKKQAQSLERSHQENNMAKANKQVVPSLSSLRKSLDVLEQVIERREAQRFYGGVAEIRKDIKRLKEAEGLKGKEKNKFNVELTALSRRFIALESEGKIKIGQHVQNQDTAARNSRPDTTQMTKLANEVLNSVRGRGNNTELDLTQYERAKVALSKLKELRQKNPNARLSTFEMTNLMAATAVIEQGMRIEEAHIEAEEVIQDMTPRAVAGQFLSGMLSLSNTEPSSANQANLRAIAVGVAENQGALTAFKSNLNMQLATLATTESAQAVEALVEVLSGERNMLIAQLMETGMTTEEATARVEAAVEQLVGQIIVPLANGTAQFIYVVNQHASKLTLTSVSVADFSTDMTIRRNLLMSAMMSGTPSNVMWGVASSEQMAALDVAISHNLLVAGSSELSAQVAAVMQLADGLSSGHALSADAMALMSPAAQSMLLQQGQRRQIIDDIDNARTRYDLSLSTGGERKPMSLSNIGAVMQGLTALLLATRNMNMARVPTHGNNRTMNHGMTPVITMVGGAMPTSAASLPSHQSIGSPSRLPGKSVKPPKQGLAVGPQRPPIQKVPRGTDKTSTDGLLNSAKMRVGEHLTEIARIVAKISQLSNGKKLRKEHQEELKTLSRRLGGRLDSFVNKQGTQAFMKMKEAMMDDIKQAEKAFAKEPGIWNNYVKPLVNALIYALQAIMSFVKIPETYQPTMFKTKAEDVWNKAGLKSQLDEIFENADLLQDIRTIEQRGPQQ